MQCKFIFKISMVAKAIETRQFSNAHSPYWIPPRSKNMGRGISPMPLPMYESTDERLGFHSLNLLCISNPTDAVIYSSYRLPMTCGFIACAKSTPHENMASI